MNRSGSLLLESPHQFMNCFCQSCRGCYGYYLMNADGQEWAIIKKINDGHLMKGPNQLVQTNIA